MKKRKKSTNRQWWLPVKRYTILLLEECALVDRNNAPNNLLNVTFDIHYSVHRHCFNTEYLSSPPVFSGVRVSGSLVLYVYFVDHCLSFCTFLFCHCVVCSSSIYGFWLSGVWCLKTLLEVIHRQYMPYQMYPGTYAFIHTLLK
jgi:hypothetical protein